MIKFTEATFFNDHTGPVWALEQYNDKLLSGSHDGTVKMWDPLVNYAKSNPKKFTGQNEDFGRIYSLRLLPTSQLAIGSQNGSITIISLEQDKQIRVMKSGPSCIYSLALVNENLVSQGSDGTLQIWDLTNGKKTHTIKDVSNYVSTVVTYDNNIICETSDTQIGIWNANNLKLLQTLPGHPKEGSDPMSRHIRAFALLEDCNTVISGSNGFDIKVWDIRSNKETKHLFGHNNYVNVIAPISGHLFASASGDKSIKIWDIRNKDSCVETIKTDHDSWIQGLITFKSEQLTALVSGSGDNTMGLFPYNTCTDTTDVVMEHAENLASLDVCVSKSKHRQFYYFTSKNNFIKCKIYLKSNDTQYIDPFLEKLQILNIKAPMKAKASIFYGVSPKLEIEFKGIICMEVILDFIKKLQQMGFKEIHENADALWFYSVQDGLEILNPQNYTSELRTFLKQEKYMIIDYLKAKKYQTLVEVGCGTGENLDLATSSSLNYMGLDFAANKINRIRKRFELMLQNGQLSRNHHYEAEDCDILQFLEKEKIDKLSSKSKTIIFFPFNVFGNIAPISLLLSKLSIYKQDFLVSLYKNDNKTLQMRKEYYNNCGYQKINIYTDKTGISFRSDEGLYTVAYNEEYLTNLIRGFGFEVHISKTTYGVIYYGQFQGVSVPRPPQQPQDEIQKSLIRLNGGGDDRNIADNGNNPNYWYSISDGCRLLSWIRMTTFQFSNNNCLPGEEFVAFRENNNRIFIADPYYADNFSNYLRDDILRLTDGSIDGHVYSDKKWTKMPTVIIIPLLAGMHWSSVVCRINYAIPQMSVLFDDPYGQGNFPESLKNKIVEALQANVQLLIQLEEVVHDMDIAIQVDL